MLTTSMNSIISTNGLIVNLLHSSNPLNKVCQNPPVNTSLSPASPAPIFLHHAAVILQDPAVFKRWKAQEVC